MSTQDKGRYSIVIIDTQTEEIIADQRSDLIACYINEEEDVRQIFIADKIPARDIIYLLLTQRQKEKEILEDHPALKEYLSPVKVDE